MGMVGNGWVSLKQGAQKAVEWAGEETHETLMSVRQQGLGTGTLSAWMEVGG